ANGEILRDGLSDGRDVSHFDGAELGEVRQRWERERIHDDATSHTAASACFLDALAFGSHEALHIVERHTTTASAALHFGERHPEFAGKLPRRRTGGNVNLFRLRDGRKCGNAAVTHWLRRAGAVRPLFFNRRRGRSRRRNRGLTPP